MKTENLFQVSPRMVKDIVGRTEMYSLGDGLCSEEFFDEEGFFLFEVVQENGTRCSFDEHEMSANIADDKRKKKLQTLLPIDVRITLRGKIASRF